MSGLAEQESRVPPLLRDRSGVQRVTNIELFFDLVYVFAVTQLSHYLLGHSTAVGALQTGLLLAMVWLVWAYTTWVTNWLDPELMAVRLLLVVLMLVSLAMSASLPRAFEDLGLWVGGAYALQQIGRSLFMVIALRGHPLEANFQRILAWCVVSSALALAGGLAHGNTRILLWLGSVCVDLLGGIVGFATPGLGRGRGGDDGQVRRPGPAGAFGVPPDPSGDGGGHHRLRGRRREGPGRPGCGRQHRFGVDDPGRPGAVPGRPRRLQAGGVARPVLAAPGRDRAAGPARTGRRCHSRPGPGRLRRRRGHRRRRQRPPAMGTRPAGA